RKMSASRPTPAVWTKRPSVERVMRSKRSLTGPLKTRITALQVARRRARLPRRHAPARPLREEWAVAGRSVAELARRKVFRGVLLRSSPPPGGGPAAGAHTRTRVSLRAPETAAFPGGGDG